MGGTKSGQAPPPLPDEVLERTRAKYVEAYERLTGRLGRLSHLERRRPMGHVVIDVMLKPEILDPQGQAVNGALPRLGFEQFTDVRQGKRFVLTVDGEVTDEHLAAAAEAAEKLLSNPVIEDVVLRAGSRDAGTPTSEGRGRHLPGLARRP